MRFLDNFSKAKREEYDQKDCSASGKFGIITTCSATYFLELGASVSLKVASKGSLRGEKHSENWDF